MIEILDGRRELRVHHAKSIASSLEGFYLQDTRSVFGRSRPNHPIAVSIGVTDREDSFSSGAR